MPSAATGRRYPLSVQLIRQCPLRNEALPLQLTNGRDQSRGAGVCCLLGRCPAAYSSPAGQSFPVKLHRAIMAALLAAALFQTEHLGPHKAPMSAPAPVERELSKAENRSAIAQAIERRDGALRDILGMGLDPVDPAEPQVWKIAGNGDRSRAGWADTVTHSARSHESRRMRRTLTAVSGV
jgi:hypothetical protein